MRRIGLIAIIFASSVPNSFAVEKGQPILGRSIAEFSLKDYRGKAYSLSDYSSSRLVVLAVWEQNAHWQSNLL